jgi:hypothetical protein
MNSYRLDSKSQDEDFLQGKDVPCDAAIRESDLARLNSGESLVVLLSNGKKYRGLIRSFHYTIENGIASGKLIITRNK